MPKTSSHKQALLIAVLASPVGVRIIAGLLLVLIGCSCAQHSSKRGIRIENDPSRHLGSKSGLRIDNGINRGTSYTDSLGNYYNLRYIPITITNDSAVPSHLHIAFSKAYAYPIAYGDEQFKVLPLPKEWALDGVDVTDSMMHDLPKYIDKPLLDVTLQPGEHLVVAIGTLYPRPPKKSGVLPSALFSHTDRGIFSECDWLMNEDPLSAFQIALKLKLDFRESCTIIPCGQISYPEHSW